jgi:tetratricopeptide (TPR) repeat protein
MGTIYERWGNVNEALNIYHKSLQCVAEWKEAVRGDDHSASQGHGASKNTTLDYSISNVQLTRSAPGNSKRGDSEKGEMELFLAPERLTAVGVSNSGNKYESFFPSHLDEQMDRSGSISKSSCSKTSRDSYADMDLALTLHQIAQLHRCQGEFARALDAYEVALRGMKCALGKHHPNVAAVLGNIGNLQKEMGDLDAAHNTYQEVLGIESYRLGLSHPDVAITIHNIATIDAARGNYEHALQLYRKVLGLQKKLFGDDHLSVAVTAACMGDVYERLGEYSNALESFEDACRIKSAALGRHSLDVARLLHKLGKLAFLRSDFHMADSFLSRAVLIYRLNKIADDHEWLVDANRDTADIDGAIVMGRGRQFEC